MLIGIFGVVRIIFYAALTYLGLINNAGELRLIMMLLFAILTELILQNVNDQ